MEDSKIIDLYWARKEQALAETDAKYGSYCRTIARNILRNFEDTEECVSDTWLHAWNSMPPQRPGILSAFLGRITRNLSFDRCKYQQAAKRGGGALPLALDELEDCASQDSLEKAMDRKELAVAFNSFLESLPETERLVFLSRYWYLDPIADIAEHFGFSVSKVTSMLRRTRGRLRQALEKEELL